MAKILAAGEAVTWEPPGQSGRAAKVAYRLAAPTVRSRLQFRRRVSELGGREVRPRQIVDEIAAALRGMEVEGEEASERDSHLARVEQLIDEWEEFGARAIDGAFDGEDGAAALLEAYRARRPLEAEIEEIGRALVPYCGRLAGLYAAVDTYAEVAGVAAAETFLVGWEGIDTPFRRTGAGVPEEVLLAMPELHLAPLGRHIETLFAPTEAEAKNSDSLSSSPSAGSISSSTDTAQ